MIDFKDAGIKPLSGLEIELRNMTGVDWGNYVQHVVKADVVFRSDYRRQRSKN